MRRLASGLALAAALAAVVLLIVALRLGDPAPVSEVERAVASTVPSTVAPRRPSPTSVPSTVAPTTVNPATSAVPASPLASLLPPRLSARPEPAVAGPTPVGLSIERLAVGEAAVVPVGVADDGTLDIPGARDVGWYLHGGRPGEPGATVLTGHINFNGQSGVFERLGELEPGDGVLVALDDGGTRAYEVVERTSYAKDALPAERVWANQGDETLVLITCGGSFDPAARRYADNIVVYAVPVG